jgi:hypothetical protein
MEVRALYWNKGKRRGKRPLPRNKSTVTPRENLDTICHPSFEEFRAEPASIRRAWISAAALYHFADCLEKSP